MFAAVLLVILFGTVFAAVHHAEVIAERIGEPFGTLLLTLAVTIIEVALIATIMLGDKAVPALARDTVFAVVMIVCNGLVGICILVGGLRYREQDVQVTGANLYLSVLIVLATITLIMPNYTLTTPGPFYSAAQLGFVSVVTIILYGVFLYTQTIRHRDYFIAGCDGDGRRRTGMLGPDAGAEHRIAAGLAAGGGAAGEEILAGGRCRARPLIGAPPAFAGILVALLILLPESVAAIGGGAQERSAEEHQSGAGFVAGDHRADHSGGRGRGLRAGQDTGPRPQRPGDGAAAVDLPAQHAHLRHRPHQYPVRAGASGGVCGIRVPGIRALSRSSEEIRRCSAAKSDVQVDTPEVRVTEWRLAPGSATGHHTHEMDYVIVPVTAGEMTIVAPNGDRSKAQLGVGKSYFRKAGVQHDVLNETSTEIVFLEVELKP